MTAGEVVEFHGPTAGGLMYGEHLRVVAVLPHGSKWKPGCEKSVVVGDWLRVSDGQADYLVPQRETHPVAGRCLCDVCG